jgi:two-component system nitrogen regulation sensor histidine kinase GlnL
VSDAPSAMTDPAAAASRPDGAAKYPTDDDTLLTLMKTGLVRLNERADVVFANPAAQYFLGASASKLCGAPLSAALDDDVLTPLIERSLASRRSFVCRELQLVPRSATTRASTIDCHLTPLESQGQPDGLLLEMQDAQTRVRFDRDAAQLVQQGVSRTMIRQLAHEIKNPLGGLRGAAQLLERRLPESERDYTGVIIREADRLARLVDEMLGPDSHPRPLWLNVHEAVFDVERLVAAEAPDGVTVVGDYDPSLPDVIVDRNEVIQALLNIARNALQSLGQQGRLMLRTRSASNVVIRGVHKALMVRIDVEDDGPGVPDALRETLFFPLVTGRPDGTGLGLPTAQELINRQGGSVEYRSEPGRTVFSIMLPVEADKR